MIEFPENNFPYDPFKDGFAGILSIIVSLIMCYITELFFVFFKDKTGLWHKKEKRKAATKKEV